MRRRRKQTITLAAVVMEIRSSHLQELGVDLSPQLKAGEGR
jgi:hypothetical protein